MKRIGFIFEFLAGGGSELQRGARPQNAPPRGYGPAPPYLCDLVHDYLPRRTLRSGDGATFEVPRKTVTAERAFRVAAPTIWNDLPLNLRQSTYFDGFKTELKTHLFTIRVNHSHLYYYYHLAF